MSDLSTTLDVGDQSPISTEPIVEAGTTLGLWQIDGLIAIGGQGAVYKGHHTRTDALGAIKILHPSLLFVPRMVDRFLREMDLLLRLDHPNIIQFREGGSLHHGLPYYVMEYLEGKTLRTWLDEMGRLDTFEVFSVLEPVCSALEFAHSLGIVHRDVKASNIIITHDMPAQVKLFDFGIAKLLEPDENNSGFTSVGRQVGTPSVMAPEQIAGGTIDARTDVYALGALLYQMLTGRKPFESPTPSGLAQLHLETPPPRPSERVPISSAFDALVSRAMDKRPSNRHPTVGAFLDALRQAVHGATPLASRSDDQYALGLFVDIRPQTSSEMDNDSLDNAAACALDLAEDHIRRQELVIALCTSNSILGIQLLEATSTRTRVQRHALLDLARRLRTTFAEDDAIHVNVTLHVDHVTSSPQQNGDPEITSADLARTETWAPIENIDGICATPAFLEGLEGLVLLSGPQGLFVIV